MQNHTGKVAMVTGAARGIGRSIAERLAAEGALIGVVDIAAPDETIERIQKAGGRAAPIIADVASPEQVAAAVAAIECALGPVAILVNNAAIHANPLTHFADMTFEQWRRFMSVNLDSMFHCCKAVLANMRAAGWGRIVNMGASAVNALTPPGLAHYITSKAAVVGLTRALATDLGEFGITVNAVAPSGVRTPGILEIAETEDLMPMVAQMQAIKRVMEPEDVVGAVSFLASDDAAMITAQVLFADGGAIRAG